MKFIDLFAGIGGFRLGMEMAGHECVGFCEIDKFAQRSYRAIHDTEGEWFADDIRTIDPRDIPDFDCITGGFPCQAFSVAGKRGGFEDTRGTLFFEIARIIRARQPKLVFLENVRGLLNHDGGRTFGTILNTFWELGYDVEWQLLNSKDFGVPQNRERIFIIGYPRGTRGRKVFPIRETNTTALKQIIGGSQGYRVYDTQGLSCTLASEAGGMGAKTGLYLLNGTKEGNTYCLDANYAKGETKLEKSKRSMVKCLNTKDGKGKQPPQQARVYSTDGLMTALQAEQNGRFNIAIKEATRKGYDIAIEGDSINLAVPGSKTRRGRVGKGIANTLDTSCNQGTLEGTRIRKLTPRECFRLQGFPDWTFDKAREVNSDSQLYKQAGNSVTVNVIYEIAKRL